MECHELCLIPSAAVRGKIEMRNCFRFLSKVPFLTARFRRHMQGLRSMEVCHVWCLSHTAVVRGEVDTKTVSASRLKCPLERPDFDQTWNGCGTCRRNATCGVSVNSLQWLVSQRRETVSIPGVNCSLLLPDVDQAYIVCGASRWSATCSVGSPLCIASRDEKLLRPQE
jgi:hypothetical protein